MNTETAKQIAHKRHEFMEQFVEQFFKRMEWTRIGSILLSNILQRF